jgi:predicted membrane protein
MKKASSVLWGIVLIAAGVVLALNVLNITDIDIFFDGWWTLFIIVPCAIGLFTEREKTGNLIGIVIGVFMLLCCRDILSFDLIGKLIWPALIILVGLKLVIDALRGNKGKKLLEEMKQNGQTPIYTSAIFGASEQKFDGEVFTGARLTAIFGAVQLDLRNAVIPADCAIQVTTVFGGVDILLPEHINAEVRVSSIFGGTSNPKNHRKDMPTVYVTGVCLFGGVQIQ